MKLSDIRRGKYGMYNGKLYRILLKSISLKSDIIEICSTDMQDLKNGFTNDDPEFITQKYGFTCTKKIPKSEITQAYEIRTHAKYKGVSASIMGSLKPGCIRLATTCLYWLGEDRDEFLKNATNAGFEYTDTEQGGYKIYEKEVSLDDPDLELIEKRTEIDISKL